MENISSGLYRALYVKFGAEREVAKVNLEAYFRRPVGVAEHPNIIESMDTLFDKYCCACEKLERLEADFGHFQEGRDGET